MAASKPVTAFATILPALPTSYLDVATLDRIYTVVVTNLNMLTMVIRISEQLWHLMDDGAKAYFAYRFMYTHVKGNVLFVKDGDHGTGYYLGPAEEFTRGLRVLVVHEDHIPVYYSTTPDSFLPTAPFVPCVTDFKDVRQIMHVDPKIPRPPNAYIIYRKERHHIVKSTYPGITNNEISQLLGKSWASETDETRLYYKALANEEKRKLLEAHPEYRYQPRKPGQKKRRSKSQTATLASAIDGASSVTIVDASTQEEI